MTKEFSVAFAADWLRAWNDHDLNKILSFYSDDFTIESPMALKLCPHTNGTIAGKSEVKKYWSIGLEKSPNLKFELLEIFVGINSLALYLFNASSNKKSVEVMGFNADNKVCKTITCFFE